jgi:hypothetical protein
MYWYLRDANYGFKRNIKPWASISKDINETEERSNERENGFHACKWCGLGKNKDFQEE